ncbi:VOC family protein [Actinoallomurus bryophytorum]|uniref:VOC domain-containing protein n=2 Tax=Actinoallomurus bryophytorum TaxID=1490222 RepID=A0A543CRM8_9ACTN|nr:hypothetical protein FB559_5447 [Actinoallomurus bryophytorum]
MIFRGNTDIGLSPDGGIVGAFHTNPEGRMMNDNSVGWFEVGTDRPEDARSFYGELFGWTFANGPKYSEVTTPGVPHPTGGIADTGGEFPAYAIFYVVVRDVAATLARAESLGGKIVTPPATSPDGLVSARLEDSTGSLFGVFSPPGA